MPEPPARGSSSREARRAAARRRLTARRRRIALGVLAGAAALAGALAGRDGDDGSHPGAGAPQTVGPSCPGALAGSPAKLAGQRLVVRLDAAPSKSLLDRARRGRIAGVILFPPPGTRPPEVRRWTAQLDHAAARGSMPEPLVLIDQEGGEVERLPELPPDTPPARIEEPAAALEEGERAGAALAALGVDVDLAPVVDVPASGSAFIASRAFPGASARSAQLASAFARGLESEGVAATAKHFPGLGRATVNTDEAPSTVDASRRELRRELAAFGTVIEGGVELVMVANATYPAFDPRRPASLSPRIIDGVLRDELAFDGVIVTDDLGAGALSAAGIDEGQAALAAARAGADLLLLALSDGKAAHRELVRALRRDVIDHDAALAACARVTGLR